MVIDSDPPPVTARARRLSSRALRPTSCAGPAPHRATKGCAAMEQTSTAPTTPPMTARLLIPAVRFSTAGMTAKNRPATAQARKPVAAAVVNRSRIPVGMRGRVGLHRRARCGGAGRADTRCQPIASNPKCTRYGNTCGCGAYCATTPAAIGPTAVPATNAILATTDARPRFADGVWSVITMVAAPVTAPSASPWAARPTSNHPTPSASTKHVEANAATATPTRSTVRGPSASAAGPNNSRAGALTSANIA